MTDNSPLPDRNRPSELYKSRVKQKGFEPDDHQLEAMSVLDTIYDREYTNGFETIKASSAGGLGRLTSLLFGTGRKAKLDRPQGCYMWGGVGRGKTFVMDIFFACLPPGSAQRTHFHRFMREVHQKLERLKGRSDPLKEVAKDIAAQGYILCLDEFLVNDITDAMILSGLLEGLFDHGVILVTTSNTPPANLYKNGLQRARFLPAIDLLEQRVKVIELDAGNDYRLKTLMQSDLFHVPAGSSADEKMTDAFKKLSHGIDDVKQKESILVENRNILTKAVTENLVWFEFAQLCDGPRSQLDYLQLASEYSTIFLSNIPMFDGANDSPARRFILLIDVLYDHGVKLVASSANKIENIYEGKELAFEFQRTQSRLSEMQSAEYLQKSHC